LRHCADKPIRGQDDSRTGRFAVNATYTHVYLTNQATRKGEASIVLATRDRLTDKKEIDRRKTELQIN